MSTIPSEADWRSEPWDLDTPCAYEHFAGKSLGAAIALFEENALHYQEDVMVMPVACFRFYVRAYVEYLLSRESKGDSDGASCFFGLVQMRRKDICGDKTLVDMIAVALRHIQTRQGWYDADESIYDSFVEKAQESLKLIGVRR